MGLAPQPRFVRLGETGRPAVTIFVDGAAVAAFVGDTLLVAVLTHSGKLRRSEFGGTARAGFCLMAACQDCWVWTEAGERLARLRHAGRGRSLHSHRTAGWIMAEPRVIIVGAGPAGVRAAETLVDAGLRPIVIDEGARDGGQIYRRQPEGFTRPHSTLYGSETARAEALHATFDRLKGRIDYRPRHLAWNIADGHVHLVSEGRRKRPAL